MKLNIETHQQSSAAEISAARGIWLKPLSEIYTRQTIGPAQTFFFYSYFFLFYHGVIAGNNKVQLPHEARRASIVVVYICIYRSVVMFFSCLSDLLNKVDRCNRKTRARPSREGKLSKVVTLGLRCTYYR